MIRVLDALTNIDADARVLLRSEPLPATGQGESSSAAKVCVGGASGDQSSHGGGSGAGMSFLKVLHLNPSVYFAQVLKEAHAVVLAGGTMQPLADLEMQLFRSLPSGRYRAHSFGHIVPARNLMPLALSSGPAGVPLNFNFASRSSAALMDELGACMLQLCSVVPDGIVAFVPSFAYEEQLVAHWQRTGLWSKLARLKVLYREPREASELDAVLKSYARTIEENFAGGPACQSRAARDGGAPSSSPRAGGAGGGSAGTRGALLLSVVGGKMSEGINFADGLGRCVVMVGMPFANPSDLTLCERMVHLDASQGAGAGRSTTPPCMKAVNQSIGRAIRHIGDYATIIMADARFAKPAVRKRLPRWIADHVQNAPSFAEAVASIQDFFNGRAAEQESLESRRKARYDGVEID